VTSADQAIARAVTSVDRGIGRIETLAKWDVLHI
jgi:hypothetical protein